jgi:hypothetical protein
MDKFEEANAKIEVWLAFLRPMSAEEFCHAWVPVIYQIPPSSPRYNRACTHLMGKISGKNKKTIQNWLSGSQATPDNLKLLFRAIHTVWQLRQAFVKVFPFS